MPQWFSVLALLVLIGACDAPKTNMAPHIVLIVADDLGLDQAPCYAAGTQMSYLQSMCEDGLVFRRVYTHPYCTASRAALLTGRHPFRHGANDVRLNARKLPLSEYTLAELIKEKSQSGYRTSAFGKWHLADDENGSEQNPILQGFDHFAGTPRQTHAYDYFEFEWYEHGEQSRSVNTYRTSFIVSEVVRYFQERD